jgi:hypothetical protein
MKKVALFFLVVLAITTGIRFGSRRVIRHVSAQTAPYTCPSGQFVNSQLVNTGQACGALPSSTITVNSVACSLGGSCTLPASSSPVSFYLNGTLQTATVKCGYYTGTTAANGTATVSYSGLGLTTVFGPPNVSMSNAAASTGQVTSYTNTSANILTQGGTTISIVGINILSLSGSAMPYGLFVCGV